MALLWILRFAQRITNARSFGIEEKLALFASNKVKT